MKDVRVYVAQGRTKGSSISLPSRTSEVIVSGGTRTVLVQYCEVSPYVPFGNWAVAFDRALMRMAGPPVSVLLASWSSSSFAQPHCQDLVPLSSPTFEPEPPLKLNSLPMLLLAA